MLRNEIMELMEKAELQGMHLFTMKRVKWSKERSTPEKIILECFKPRPLKGI